MKNKLVPFFAIDNRALAVLRIGIAIIIIIDLLMRLTAFEAHYTDYGIFPRVAVMEHYGHWWKWSVFFLNGSYLFQTMLFYCMGIVAIFLLFGFHTKWAVFFSWIFWVSLLVRTPVILNGGDKILALLFFWCLFLPLGRRWSLDAISRSRGQANLSYPYTLSMGTACLLLQIAFVYFFTGIFKLNATWLDGSALYEVLSSGFYASSNAAFLLKYPILLKYASICIPWLEIICPLLAFSPFLTLPLRKIMAILGIIFHVSIAVFLKVGLFPYISMLSLIIFFPSSFWEKIENFPIIQRSQAVILKGVKNDNRQPKPASVSNLSVKFFQKGKGLLINVTCLLFLLYILAWNLSVVQEENFFKKKGRLMPEPFEWVGELFYIDQKWIMFSWLDGTGNDGYVIPARLKNGTVVDLMRAGEPFVKGRYYFPNHLPHYRWREMYKKLLFRKYDQFFPYLAQYHCQTWNDTHLPQEQAESIDIIFRKQRNLSDYPREYLVNKIFANWNCFASLEENVENHERSNCAQR